MGASHAGCGDAAALHRILEDIAHYLPSQGPIKTFVHHNTLHHFEELDFFDALDAASDVYGANTAFSHQIALGVLKIVGEHHFAPF